jgi:DNA-binding transcriptional ArsR family regulator
MEGEIFRALADPTRRAIYERLTRGEATVKELTAAFEVSQPAVSQHLQALKRAELIVERRAGKFTYYRAAPGGLKPLVNWLEHHQAFWLEKMQQLKALLEETDP